MTRTRLRNRFLKNRSAENRKLFSNKEISAFQFSENLTFLENRQTLLVKKIHLYERINLTEDENNSLLKNSEEGAKELNNFFSNAVKNLNTSNYENCDSLAENINNLL